MYEMVIAMSPGSEFMMTLRLELIDLCPDNDIFNRPLQSHGCISAVHFWVANARGVRHSEKGGERGW